MNLVNELVHLKYTNIQAIKRALTLSNSTKKEVLDIYRNSFSKEDFYAAITESHTCPEKVGLEENSLCYYTKCKICWKDRIEKELNK